MAITDWPPRNRKKEISRRSFYCLQEESLLELKKIRKALEEREKP
jgi:hypothetical protein